MYHMHYKVFKRNQLLVETVINSGGSFDINFVSPSPLHSEPVMFSI